MRQARWAAGHAGGLVNYTCPPLTLRLYRGPCRVPTSHPGVEIPLRHLLLSRVRRCYNQFCAWLTLGSRLCAVGSPVPSLRMEPVRSRMWLTKHLTGEATIVKLLAPAAESAPAPCQGELPASVSLEKQSEEIQRRSRCPLPSVAEYDGAGRSRGHKLGRVHPRCAAEALAAGDMQEPRLRPSIGSCI
jgi:hypothetical protein